MAIIFIITGVTSYCPTVITAPSNVYHRILPWIGPRPGGPHGPEVLGAHVEGPFISREKKGAHTEEFIQDLESGFEDVASTYGEDNLKNVRVVTMAPEKDPEGKVVKKLVGRNITVSLGHSMGTLSQGEQAVRQGKEDNLQFFKFLGKNLCV